MGGGLPHPPRPAPYANAPSQPSPTGCSPTPPPVGVRVGGWSALRGWGYPPPAPPLGGSPVRKRDVRPHAHHAHMHTRTRSAR